MTAYATEAGAMDWGIASPSTTIFDFDYESGRDQLLRLYDKGTRRQWIGSDRIDWSIDVDPTNPPGMPDEAIAIHGSPWWEKMNDAEKGEVRRHLEAWRFSQFMHGEQGALICTAKIVQTVPDIDSKFYAATQVIDEARHVEVYSRYLHEKIGLVYPLNANLQVAARRRDLRQPLGHDLPRDAGAHRGPGAGRLRPDPQHGRGPAGQGDQRLRDAGRGPPRDVRPPGAAGLLPAAHPGRAGRARGVLRRRLLPHAGPLPGRGGLARRSACRPR